MVDEGGIIVVAFPNTKIKQVDLTSYIPEGLLDGVKTPRCGKKKPCSEFKDGVCQYRCRR